MEPNKTAKDELGILVDEIKSYCKEQELPLYFSLTRPNIKNTIQWNSYVYNDFKAFLDIAKNNNVKVVYLYQGRLLKEDAERLGHTGERVQINIAYVLNNMTHTFLKVASWWKPPENVTSKKPDINSESYIR